MRTVQGVLRAGERGDERGAGGDGAAVPGGLVLERGLGRLPGQHCQSVTPDITAITVITVIITLADKQLKYEALVRRRRARAEEDAEKMRPDPVKLDIMSLEGYESF